LNPHKQILMKVPSKLTQLGGSYGIILSPEMRDKFGIKETDELVMSLQKGKHGLYLAIWKNKRG